MITVGSLAFAYDGRGRAKQSGTASNLINGIGQRVAKTTSGNTTYFAYDEQGKLIGEYDMAGAMIQETVWLNDQPVATIKPKVAPATGYDVFYIWADNLNTPRTISRPIDNQVVWRYELQEPFGNAAPNQNPSGLGNFDYNLRESWQYHDQETGTQFNWNRDYVPEIGRYIQSDPIGLAGGFATYSYVDADPLRQIDSTGLVSSGKKDPDCCDDVQASCTCRAKLTGGPGYEVDPKSGKSRKKCLYECNCSCSLKSQDDPRTWGFNPKTRKFKNPRKMWDISGSFTSMGLTQQSQQGWDRGNDTCYGQSGMPPVAVEFSIGGGSGSSTDPDVGKFLDEAQKKCCASAK